jgi:hypothetical protein
MEDEEIAEPHVNSWTQSKLEKLKDWMRLSQIYSTCHSKAQDYYHAQFSRITIWVIFLGALAAVLEGANLLLPDRNIGLGVTVILITSTVSGLNVWLNSKNPAEAASAHENMSKGYNRIILKIESELTNDEQERANGVKFLEEIRDNLTDLSTGGKSIPSWIWDDVNHVPSNTANVTKASNTSNISNSSLKTEDPGPPSPRRSEPTLEVNFNYHRPSEILTKYQTARYRSAY